MGTALLIASIRSSMNTGKLTMVRIRTQTPIGQSKFSGASTPVNFEMQFVRYIKERTSSAFAQAMHRVFEACRQIGNLTNVKVLGRC
jgi:hypothetical protein